LSEPQAISGEQGSSCTMTQKPSCADMPLAVSGQQTTILFLVSVVGLFLELMLIRWIGTEIRIFAYLQNTILIVCFLGLGMGCWTCRRPFVLREMLLPLFLLVVLLAIPFTRLGLRAISDMLASFGGVPIWFYQELSDHPGTTALYGLFGLSITFLLMILVWETFVPVGRLLGQAFDQHPHTIQAYSINIAGSLIGIWLFVLLSVFYLSPVIWLAIFAVLLVALCRFLGPISLTDRLLLVGIVVLAWVASQEWKAAAVLWSPYQKLVLQATSPQEEVGDYRLTVNNVGYQALQNLSDDYVKQHPEIFPTDERRRGQYDLPLIFHPHPERMLIVGAGTGNDAAGGVRHGVKEIVAVDIDPAIIALGKEYHPERPYAPGSAVQVVNDDARSYFASCPPKQFDLIVFGLLDAHTGTSMTNAQLDHFVYTRESLRRARDLLRDGGVIVLSFWAKRPYITDRLGTALHEVFGEEPLRFFIPQDQYGWGGAMFVSGDLATVRMQIDRYPLVKAKIAEWQAKRPMPLTGTTLLATDDWPYLYLESPSIPVMYYFVAALMVLLFVRGRRRLQMPSLRTHWRQSHWHFFFLGAAFLLLEVQNISKASVVLGNTWVVNAVIISGILLLILLANLIAARFPRLPLGPVYALLCGTCLGLYFVDLSGLAFWPYAAKLVAVGLVTSLPILFSGIVFIRSFAAVEGKDAALGANLFGSLVGGLLQSVTFVTGIKALLLIVAALYLAAFLTRPKMTEKAAAQASLEPSMA
jgi:SAM-dependent methyltransferase